MKLLYIEDDARAAADVRDLAWKQGDTIVVESEAQAGLRRAGMEAFDVIIMDRMLGDADGLQLVARLRSSGISPPVLMRSALGRTSDRA